MSPRRTRRRVDRPPPPPTAAVGGETVEEAPDGSWLVRRLVGSPGRVYRCPGCDQEFPSTTAHVVVWPANGVFAGADARRHWHTACWQRRARRGVKAHRSKNAPRYG